MAQYLMISQLGLQMKIKLNNFGLYLILLFLMFVLVHKEVANIFAFYRELFGLAFLVLLFIHKSSYIYQSIINRRIIIEIIFLMLFPFIIIITALFDPMNVLYGDPLSEGVTAYDGSVNPKIYVFRNAVIYLPMVFYIAIRGLSKSDINKIAGVTALFAPISIIIYMLTVSDDSLLSQFEQLITGHTGLKPFSIEYNTYVPCFAIAGLSILYLMELQYKKYNQIIKVSLISILIFVSMFIFFSTSRQSLLLALIYITIFATKNIFYSRWKNILFYASFGLALYFCYYLIFLQYGENISVTNKLTSEVLTSPRLRVALDGLAMLHKTEFFTGAGLTSVLVSGPHNDYVRWIQRVGFIYAFISFYPYFSAMYKSFLDVISSKFDSVNLFIFCISLFIIYNSFFGHPREDAYQSIWCFLGISMWLGHNNHMRRKKNLNKGKLH